MQGYAVIAILTLAPGLLPAGNKLTWEDRVELTRGLTAEYATVKALLPRSSKPLVFDATGGYDKNQWTAIARESYAVIAILTLAPGLLPAGNKLTWEDRVSLTRGLTAEYATVKALLPRSRQPLVFDATGRYDKNQWAAIARESGPAARN